MKSLKSFLSPKRKPNLKFVLSEAFVDEQGEPLEWEMRQLSGQEMLDISKNASEDDQYSPLVISIANAMVFPDLCNKELLDGLSQRENRPVLKAEDALVTLLTQGELTELISVFGNHNSTYASFREQVEDAKN